MLIFVLLTTLFTANDLKQRCTSNVLIEQGICLGYLQGFNHAIEFAAMVAPQVRSALALDTAAAVETAIEGRQRLMGCMSEGVTVEQARLVFLKCVDNHPEELHLPAMKVLSNAMLVAFPCGADSDPEIRTLSAPKRKAGRCLPAIFLTPKGHDSGKKG